MQENHSRTLGGDRNSIHRREYILWVPRHKKMPWYRWLYNTSTAQTLITKRRLWLSQWVPWDPAQIQPPETRISQAAAKVTWRQLIAYPFSGNCSPPVRSHSFSCKAAPKTWQGDIRPPKGWPPCSSAQLWRAIPALELVDWLRTRCKRVLVQLSSASFTDVPKHTPQ